MAQRMMFIWEDKKYSYFYNSYNGSYSIDFVSIKMLNCIISNLKTYICVCVWGGGGDG